MTDLLPKYPYSRKKKKGHFFNNLFNLTRNREVFWQNPVPTLTPLRVFRAAGSGLLTASGWFHSAPVLISLRWHGGDADLIIVMVAGGSHPLHTSATASHLRSSRLAAGQPRAPSPPPPTTPPQPDPTRPDPTPPSPGISFKLQPCEMQVLGRTPRPVRFRQQNFFSKDDAVKRLLPPPPPLLLRRTVPVHMTAHIHTSALLFSPHRGGGW